MNDSFNIQMIGMKNLTNLERESILKDSWKISGWFNSETIWHTFSSISGIHFLPMKGKDRPCLPSMNWKQMSLLSYSKPYMPLEGCSLSFHLVMLLNLSHIIIQKLGLHSKVLYSHPFDLQKI